ncbi:MAG: hypothetical protein JWP87_1175 [Labilithrix sp.]|nr:hypothetical protein [Labilithrix sp.]
MARRRETPRIDMCEHVEDSLGPERREARSEDADQKLPVTPAVVPPKNGVIEMPLFRETLSCPVLTVA